MKYRVVRNICRPKPETTKLLTELGVATVHEAMGRAGLARPYLRPIYPGAKIGGPAVTALTVRIYVSVGGPQVGSRFVARRDSWKLR